MAIINKAASGTNLGAGASWTGGVAPQTTDVGTWVSGSLGGALTSATSFLPGGINVQTATAAITVTSTTSGVSIGTSGIVIASGGVDVTFTSTFAGGHGINTQPWTVGAGRKLTFNARLNSGGSTYAVTINGAGTIVVTQAVVTIASTSIAISAGVTQVGNATALGGASNTITMTGGKLSSSSATGYTLANPLTLNGTMTLGDATNNGALTFSGATIFSGTTTLTTASSVAFTGAITVNASINATVNNADAGSAGVFRGATAINGTLTSGSPNLFGYHTNASASTVTINTGGTLTNGSNSHLITVGPLVMAGGTLTSGAQQVAGSAFSGAYILRGNVTATNDSTISGFPIAIGTPSDTTITGTINVSSGKTLSVNANIVNSVNLGFSAAVTTNIAQQTGTGTLVLSGANTFTGTVAVNAGLLSATTNATALGATNGGALSVASSASLSLGVAVSYGSRSLTISGPGSASAPNNGALIIANAGTNTFSGITIGATGTYIRATNSGSINAPFTSNNNSIVFGASAGFDFIPFASLLNVFSGLGSVTYGGHSLDTGIVRADVRHIYTGNTTLAFGTTYVDSSLELAATGGPLGNKSLSAANTLLMTGGTLSYLGGSVDYSGRFSTAGGQQWRINTGASAVTFSSSLQGNSSLSLLGGDLSLSGNSRFSSFTNGVNLVNGTLTLDAPVVFVGLVPNSSPIGVSGTITFTGGTLRYTTSNSFDYSARFSTNAGQQWKIDTNGESVVFASSLTSTGGSLVKLALGTLNLAVANAYDSGTTLSAGTLKCGNSNALGTGAVTISSSAATLQTLTTGGQNGKLTVASLNNAAGGTIKIGG